jgi:NTP pyrophosphatase (non-canonical NTP hydrolase)
MKPAEHIALIHSELSECLEEFRAGHEATEIYYRESDQKPEGVPIELADAVIRCFDMAYVFGIDLEAAIKEKHAFNKTRPYLHGKEF